MKDFRLKIGLTNRYYLENLDLSKTNKSRRSNRSNTDVKPLQLEFRRKILSNRMRLCNDEFSSVINSHLARIRQAQHHTL